MSYNEKKRKKFPNFFKYFSDIKMLYFFNLKNVLCCTLHVDLIKRSKLLINLIIKFTEILKATLQTKVSLVDACIHSMKTVCVGKYS